MFHASLSDKAAEYKVSLNYSEGKAAYLALITVSKSLVR